MKNRQHISFDNTENIMTCNKNKVFNGYYLNFSEPFQNNFSRGLAVNNEKSGYWEFGAKINKFPLHLEKPIRYQITDKIYFV